MLIYNFDRVLLANLENCIFINGNLKPIEL